MVSDTEWEWGDPCPECGNDGIDGAFVLVETVRTPIRLTSDGSYEPGDRLGSEYQHVECQECGRELPADSLP